MCCEQGRRETGDGLLLDYVHCGKTDGETPPASGRIVQQMQMPKERGRAVRVSMHLSACAWRAQSRYNQGARGLEERSERRERGLVDERETCLVLGRVDGSMATYWFRVENRYSLHAMLV